MIGTRTAAGHSLLLNILFTVLNLVGLAFTAIAFHANFTDYKLLFASIGIGLLAFSIAGIIVFKGRLMLAGVARVFVGSLFIVSGLIKANDPIGFSYKLKEYFEDGALAYRIKEWFNTPGFSLEVLIGYAVGISVFICIAEIVIGVLLLIGGKPRLTSWLLMLMMLFFTFLTWHTASCDPHEKFTDRDTYELSNQRESRTAAGKIGESKTNQDIRIISKNGSRVVVDEMRSTQCVADCGCFGDALKGSVGRSLTPSESRWKDLVLLYMAIWIFAARRMIVPNSVRQNWIIIPVSLTLVAFFCWVFNWYFPLFFTALTLITALWIYRSGGKTLGNHYSSALMTIIWCGAFVWYCMMYTPLKDYRPYAVGSDLNAKMRDGDPGERVDMVIYRNVKTGKRVSFNAVGKDFLASKIWEKPDWKFERTKTKILRPGRLNSIDPNEFNPLLDVDDVTKYERSLKPVAEQLKKSRTTGLKIKDLASGAVTEIMQVEYNVESYPPANYQVIDTIEVVNEDFSEVSVRDFILTEKQIIVVFARSLKEMDKECIPELIRLMKDAEKAGVPFLFVTNADAGAIAAFRRKYHFTAPTFVNDENQLKIISRSNPVVVVLERGVVSGKYPYRSIPAFAWIQTNLFNK